MRLKQAYFFTNVPSHPAELSSNRPSLSLTSASPSTGSFLSLRKTGGYDCTYDGGSCLHVFSVWNAAFANTHSGLGGTQQIFLVTPVTLIKTPPPTPAQLFQVIPQFNYIPRLTCSCSDICTSERNVVLMEMLPSFKVNDKSSNGSYSHY